MSGFETGNFDEWTKAYIDIGAVVEVTSSLSHSGTYSCLHNDGYRSWVYKTFNVGLPKIYGSFWFRWRHYMDLPWGEDFFGTNTIFWLKGPSATQISFGWPSYLGRLDIFRGNAYDTGGVLLGVSPQWLLAPSVWHLIEFMIVIDNINGQVQVRIDGKMPYAIDLNGVNTLGDITAKTVNTIYTGFYWRPNSFIWGYWDDVVIDDSNWTNGSRIIRLPIIGNGALTQWTPSAGSNYQCIDEIPVSDTDYIQTQGFENVDLFTTSVFTPGVSCNIKSIQESVRVTKDGLNVTSIYPLLSAGVTIHRGFSKSLSFSFKNETQIWETNPLTLGAFTIADLSNLQFGVEFSSGIDALCLPSRVSLHLLLRGRDVSNYDLLVSVGGTYIPYIDGSVLYDGLPTVRLDVPDINRDSWCTYLVIGPVTISFWWAVDSEGGYDWLAFNVDDVLQSGRISGTNNDPLPWAQVSYSITSGAHTLKWKFSTDSSANPGRSCGWITNVVIE
jgi:hypothetical protein